MFLTREIILAERGRHLVWYSSDSVRRTSRSWSLYRIQFPFRRWKLSILVISQEGSTPFYLCNFFQTSFIYTVFVMYLLKIFNKRTVVLSTSFGLQFKTQITTLYTHGYVPTRLRYLQFFWGFEGALTAGISHRFRLILVCIRFPRPKWSVVSYFSISYFVVELGQVLCITHFFV